MKIPNWTKRPPGDATHKWEHDELGHIVTIERSTDWEMKLNGVSLKEEPTRDNIYNVTIDWLRRNSQMDEEMKRLADAARGPMTA